MINSSLLRSQIGRAVDCHSAIRYWNVQSCFDIVQMGLHFPLLFCNAQFMVRGTIKSHKQHLLIALFLGDWWGCDLLTKTHRRNKYYPKYSLYYMNTATGLLWLFQVTLFFCFDWLLGDFKVNVQPSFNSCARISGIYFWVPTLAHPIIFLNGIICFGMRRSLYIYFISWNISICLTWENIYIIKAHVVAFNRKLTQTT